MNDMGIIKDCPRGSTEKCTDKYGCQGACAAVEQFEKEWREEQEPVQIQYKYIDIYGKDYWTSEPWEGKIVKAVRYLYTAPPQREWVGLTEDEIEDLTSVMFEEPSNEEVIAFALRVQAKLKEKNT